MNIEHQIVDSAFSVRQSRGEGVQLLLPFLAVKSTDDVSYPVVARRSPLVAAPQLANDIVY
jgi:hypothetical protein